jgi:HK97 family phage major capsid protein
MSDNLNTELKNLETEFKSAVDRAESKQADALKSALTELRAEIKALETAAGRPAIVSNITTDNETKAFDMYLRGGDTVEIKQMSALVPAEGGYTVPKLIDSQIQKAVVDISPMRSIARVVSVTTPDFHIPFSTGGTASAWVGEKDARPETATSAIVEIVPSFGELYANPFVTQTILEDSQFDIASFVTTEVATEFARSEGAAFVNGDGAKKPKGLLSVTTALTPDATRAFGTVQIVKSGDAAKITSDSIIALVHSLKAAYRPNAKFVMNKDTLGQVRMLKDSTGRYLWQDSLQSGVPGLLCGYEVVEMEDMPNVAANSTPIAFGDFQRAYTIADRVGMSMLYNPYIAAPYVTYQTRKRVGGCVVDTAAYKLLKIAA